MAYVRYDPKQRAEIVALTELTDECIDRIADAVVRKLKADTPQTESTGSPIGDYRDGAGAWQTDCEACKYGQDKHRYAHICNECGVGIDNYTPQTDCPYEDDKCFGCGDDTKCVVFDTPQTDCEDIYPLVIIQDRYTGVYSNGEYTAWNMYFDEIPQDIDGDDISCYDFWHSYNGIVGLGKTPNEAIEDLRKKLNAERNEDEK